MILRVLPVFFYAGFFALLSSGLLAQPAQPVQPASAASVAGSPASQAEALYHQALNAYLEGDYDKALLLSAQSLDKDPSHLKTKNLINILATEKDQEGKTVIWISGKPALAPAEPAPVPQVVQPPVRDDSKLESAIESLRTGMNRFFGNQGYKNTQMEGQIRTIQGLLKSNSDNKYAEIQAAQVELNKKLEKLQSAGPDLRFLYLLCAASVFFSLLALFRKPKSA